MRIIISPAKKMVRDPEGLPAEGLPRFIGEAERLRAALCALSDEELRELWKCSDALAGLNVERLRNMDLRRDLAPAVFAYEGIQYRYMAPRVMEAGQLEYLREHLRILSGLYGLLEPMDGVTPYRLEMQARLSVDGQKDLYAFWGGRLARQLAEETDLVVDLASREYSRAVEPWLPGGVRFLTCVFGERKGGRILEKGTMCKMARGQMVRWLAENRVEDPEDIKKFSDLDYRFSLGDSADNTYTFIKGGR